VSDTQTIPRDAGTPASSLGRRGGSLAGAATLVRVAAVIPCFNRQADLDALLTDLRGARLSSDLAKIELRVIVVDNLSDPPLRIDAAGLAHAELLRVPSNRGGSGGFNSGMRHALAAASPDFLWLVDSDARVEATTLLGLVERLSNRPDLCAIGPALADPQTREVFEVGGRVCRRTGRFGPVHDGPPAGDAASELVMCDYCASCCLLVRSDAVRAVGLMPDVFLNGDDVEWCIRLAQETGLSIAADPSLTAYHPRFDRFPTWARYYHARNGFGAMAALGLGRRARFRRALTETAHAVNQAFMARKDLARLHLAGLSDALFRSRLGPAPDGVLRFERFRQMAGLRDSLQNTDVSSPLGRSVFIHPDLRFTPPEAKRLCEQLELDEHEERELIARTGPIGSPRRRGWRGFFRRFVKGPKFDVAVVPSKGGPSTWFAGHVTVQLAPEGFVTRRASRSAAISRVTRMGARGLWYSILLAALPNRPTKLPRVTEGITLSKQASLRLVEPERTDRLPTLSVVVLSYNRRASLLETLRSLDEGPITRMAEIVVVDNGSTDGSVPAVRDRFPGVRLIALHANSGVHGFNVGVEAARGECVLILDDDSQPEPVSLEMALKHLASHPELAAITLLPRHPESGRAEWPSASQLQRPRDDWPMMGCGNLVRRQAWLRVGGYERSYFLYRNDADLALKILGAGMGVHFNPAWVVWHDSPAAAMKTERWLRLATRNWIWMGRRHGRGLSGLFGMLSGALWAHKLAGPDWSRQRCVLRGVWEGLTLQPSGLPRIVRPDGGAFAELVRMQLRSRSTPSPSGPTALASPPLIAPATSSASSSPRHSA
jgi:GT2 family glycosyltransferase